MTRKKVGTDNGKGKEEKRFEKFDVLDENNHDNEEKDDEFIVKMILKPLSSNDGTNLTNNLTDKPSKFSKILKKSKNRRNEETVTLTQMVKKSSKSNEASGEIILDEERSYLFPIIILQIFWSPYYLNKDIQFSILSKLFLSVIEYTAITPWELAKYE